MSLLARRRGMMGDTSKFLFPLVAGFGTPGYFDVTVTSDGHIKRYNRNRQTANKYFNLRDVARYVQTVNCKTWFTLKKGETVTFMASSLPDMELNLYLANTSTAYKMLTNTTKTLTFVVEEDVEIGCVAARTRFAIDGGTTAEFDIALYVDGRRYF